MVGKEFLDAARLIVNDVEAITVRLRVRSRGDGQLTIGVHRYRPVIFVRHCSSIVVASRGGDAFRRWVK